MINIILLLISFYFFMIFLVLNIKKEVKNRYKHVIKLVIF